jgi:hypothetical protein
MTLTISLPADAIIRLEEQAKALGLDAPTYAAQVLQNSLKPRRTLEEIREELGKRFLESGITEEELEEDLERAKHEMRAERRAKQGS